MNEEAFKHAYELFVKDGYNGTIDNFRALILSNNEALNHSYKLFERDGYKDGEESFKSLIGMPSQATQDRIAKSITPAIQEPPVEKKSPSVTTEFPSAPSSSVSFTGVDPFNLKQSMKPVSESTRVPRMEKLKTVAPAPISEEKTKLKRGELPKVKKSLDVITPQLMSGTEEKASSVMNYHFGDLGFKFEETGATGDWIIATAPNGVKSEFSIDNFTSNKDEEESKRLRNFILKNSAEGTLGQVEKSRVGEMSKFYSDKEAQDAIKKINEDTQSLIKERDNAIAEYNSGEKLAAYLDSIPVDQRDASWNEKYESAIKQKDLALGIMQGLEEKRNSVAQRTAQIETSVGSYYTMKEEQGTPYGWVWDQFTEAFGKAGAGMQNLKLEVAKKIPYFGDLMVTMNYGGDKDKNNEYKKDFIQIAKEKGIQVPKDVEDGTASFSDWKNSIAFGDVRRDEIDNQIKNKVLGEARKGVSETVIEGYKAVGDPNTSVEYSNLAKENFWVGAIAGLIDFAPAMIGTPINKAATMFAISNETMQQEFDNNPNFKDVSEADRFYYALPFNIANSVLLEFGLNRVMGNKSFVANLVTSAVSKAGSKATAYELKKIMQGEIQSALAKGTISLSKGVLSGAELGTTIYATDVVIRKTINEMKDKEMLETPESAKEFFIGAAQSAASLAVGAGIMSIHPSVKAAYAERGYKGMSDNTFLLFELASKSDVTQSALVTELKSKLASGDITMAEAKATLNSYRNSVGLLKSLPENLSLEQKKQAMDLLKEKRDVERLVEGKDPALFKKQIDRIKEINESLSKISEDAVQKQKSDEALLRAGEEKLGLQQVGKGDTQLEVTPKQEEIVTPEGTEEVTKAEPTPEVTTADPLSNVESTADALSPLVEIKSSMPEWKQDEIIAVADGVLKYIPKEEVDKGYNNDKVTGEIISEAYHKAKADGSNPELVKSVEDLLGAKPEVKTAEPTPEVATAEPTVLLSGLSEGFKGVSYESFDVRAVPEVMSEISNERSFAKVIDYKGKKYVVVGLRLETARPANTVGRDNYSFAVAELNNTTPKNIVETLKNKAKENFKNIYDDFNSKDVIKEITTKDAELATFEAKAAEPTPEVTTAEPTPEAKTSETKYRREDFPEYQANTQTKDTQKVLDYFADLLGIEKYKGDLKSGDYMSWFKNALSEARGYKGSDDLGSLLFSFNSPRQMFDKISKFAEEANLKTKVEPTPEAKTALQQATEARKAAKAALDSLRKGMGISPQGRLEALVDYHRALVKEAKEFIKEKVDDINEWAKSIGENVNVALRKAWDEAKGTIKEVQTGDELGYDLQDIFGEEISKLPGYEETMRSVQDYADFSTRNKEYWQKQVEQAKKSGNKQREAEAKAELAKYTEGNINEAMRILEESELYKSASDVQREDLVRDVRSRFELKEKKAPSPEELFGDVADANKVMEELNFLFDDANKSKDYLDEQYRKAKEAFDKNPTSEKLKENLDKAKAEVEEYRTKNIDEAIAKLKEKDLYKKATPDQQARMEKYLTDKFLKSQTEKILPTKLFGGAKDIKKVTTTEKKAWKDQLSAFVRGIKNQAEATKAAMKEVSDVVSGLAKKGEITAKQAAAIIKKMSTLKVFDAKSVDKFTDYVSKVFADAEYSSKLNTANELRGSISKLASAKGKDANLVKMAKEFKKIKPSMVEDIDAYNQMAAKIKESLRGSRTGGKDQPLNVADMVKIADVAEYTKTQLEAQEKALYEQKLAEVNELLDADLTGATLQELIDLVKSGKTIDENQETIIRDAIKKMFDINSTIIRSIIEKGEDPFTGEKIDVKESSKDLVKRFMGMDLNQMSIKEAIAAMDSLSNFLQNGSIANMKSVVESYQGKANAKRLVKEGLVAKQLRFYRIPSLGRYLGQQISTLPNLIETMFKGFTASSKFEKLSGITDLKNEKTFVQTKVNSLINEYVNKFYKEKPNGKDFEDVSNIIERAILADLRRTIQGTPEEQQAEFNRNKKLLKQSIKELKTGTEKEVELSKMYEEVYNKLDVENSKDINDIISKTDRLNIEANDWMVEKWADIYDDLADVSESVYNKILERDLFYTPKRMSSLFNRGEAKTEAQLDESLFHKNNGTVYKKKTGVLEEINRDMDKLPINETTKRATRFVDLSFDKNNFNAMYDALMDIHTAGTIRKIESFFKSPEIEKIIPNPEDRAILYNSDNTGRVQDFIRAARNKEMVVSDETAKLVRKLNTISSIGTATALGSFMQPFKQVIPVAANTLINTRGKLDFNYFGDKNDFMNRIGYGISVRGIESQAQVSSINKLVDLASKSKGAKALEYIEKANRIYLDAFLKNPDVYIAKASWMSYYEKALKKQNIDPKTIDYKTHKVNKEAADYAQKMVDRQQNISDTDLQGKLLGTKDQAKRFAISAVMPFASFRLNQFMRAKSDLATVFSLSSSTQDRKIAASSLAGYGAEMAVFKGMATMIGLGFGSLTNYLMGKDETDEEYQKRKENLYRAQATGTVTDVFSPIPMLDYFYAKGADVGLDIAQGMMNIEDDEKFKLMTNYKTDILKSLGTIGIAGQKAKTVYDAISLGATGEFEDEYGRTRYVSQNDREALKLVGGVSALAAFGLFPFPSDVNTISRNAVKSAKRTASNKEGGQTEEDIMVEREMKQESEISKQETQEERELKASVLNEMMKSEYDEDKIDIINRKMQEYLMTDEERTQYNLKMKNQRFYEKKRLKQLLGKYDSQSDMKKYDPVLYEETFGENSAWYLENKDEEDVEKELNKKLTEMEDAEFDYYKPSKKKKSGIGSSIGGQKIGSSIGASKIGEK